MNILTVERLKHLLFYDHETGDFTRLTRAAQKTKIGDIAGGKNECGYIRIRVDGKKYRAHRLAVFYMTGKWPVKEPDHRDLNKGNNRWNNIRLGTRSQNRANTRPPSNNTSGFKGVYWRPKKKFWYAAIGVNNKKKFLGQFDCPAAAQFAYVVAADKAFGEFARSN